MIAQTTRLCPNTDEVAAKVMDGEAIMINLSNGMYYSMDRVGGRIWELVAEERSLQEIAASIAEEYDVQPAQALSDVHRLAEELLAENLVLANAEAAPGAGQGGPGPSNSAASGSKLAYESPLLNVYRDMGDLLALDPPMPGMKDVAWQDDEGEAGD